MDIKNFKNFIKFVVPDHRSVMVSGVHGCGKSSVFRQISEERAKDLLAAGAISDLETGYGYVDLRLSQNDAGDLKGFPFLVGGRTYFAPPAWFPLHAEDKARLESLLKQAGMEMIDFNSAPYGTLLLDEINRGQEETIQIAFQLVLDRRMGDWRIADGWRIFAAINPAGNGNYKVRAMDPALVDRFDLVDLRPSFDDLRIYAKETKVLEGQTVVKIHPVIMQYLEIHDTFVDPTDSMIEKSVSDGGSKLHSRRSWEALSDKLHKIDIGRKKGLHNLDWADKGQKALLIETCKATVGTLVTDSFCTFVEKQYKTLTAELVLKNWKDEVSEDVKNANPLELSTLNEDIIRHLLGLETSGKKVPDVQVKNFRSYSLTLKESSGELLAHLWATPKKLIESGEFTGVNICSTLVGLFTKDTEVKDAFTKVLTGKK